MKSLTEITDYVWTNQPSRQNVPFTKLERWVNWYFQQGFIMLAMNVDDSISGLAMIRPIMEPIDAKDPLSFDPEGRCLYIAEVISTARGALQALGFAALKRFGMRELVCWERAPENILEVHKATSLRRNLFRKNHVTA